MFKKLAVAVAAAGALCAAQASTVLVTNGGANGVQANIDDAGNFDYTAPGGIMLSYKGVDFLEWGTASSWYWFANGTDNVAQFGSNPLGATTLPVGPSAATSIAMGGWSFAQTVFASAPNKLTVILNLTNNTGATVSNAMWGVGIDPDQDIPGFGTFSTQNTINAQGAGASVTATGTGSGYSITLANDTSAAATAITAYINHGDCCNAVAPSWAMANGQAAGFSVYGDDSISLAYQFGDIKNGQTVSIGYSYTFAVPEPETYALMLAGLAAVGFVARRRRAA